MFVDEPMPARNADVLEVREHASARVPNVDFGIARKSDLDVHAEPITIENVVVEPDAIERSSPVRVVDPVHVLRSLAVEAEIEDEHLVPGENLRIVCDVR